MPSFSGSCYALSYMEAIADDILVLAGLRGSLVVVKTGREEPSYQTQVNGAVTALTMIECSTGQFVSVILQDDTLTGYWLHLYEIDGDSLKPFTKVPLPTGTFIIVASYLYHLDISSPPHVVFLDGFILVVSETKAHLYELVGAELFVRNRFVINTQPPASYVEPKTLISCFSRPIAHANGLLFFASTNKGEILSFIFKNGKFVVSPMNIIDSDFSGRKVFSALHYDSIYNCLLGAGENFDGAIMKVNEPFNSAEVLRLLPNWAPIVDLDASCTKKSLVLAGCGNSGVNGQVNQIRSGVRNSIIMQSDAQFRGVSRIWPLKRFKSDTHHSFIAVSFPLTTCLFSLKENELEPVSSCGLETSCTTVTMANLDTTSFWIQVCPDRVLAVKICEPDMLKTPMATVWRPEETLQVVSATILRNYVILLDESSNMVRILHAACNISRGSADITEAGQIHLPPASQPSYSTAFPLRLGPESEFILAVACDQEILFWRVKIGSEFAYEPLKIMATDAPVNSMAFWRHSDRIFLGIGFRDGRASFYSVSDNRIEHLLSAVIGSAPVRVTMVKQERGDQSVCCTSRGVWFIANHPDGSLSCEKFHPHVDAFFQIYLASASQQQTFIATKKDSIIVIEATLEPSTWLYRLLSGPDLRRAQIALDGTALITSVSTSTSSASFDQSTLEMFSLSELEGLFRTKIPAHITSICRLRKDGLIAVASLDPSGHGSLHLYQFNAPPPEKDRHTRRRGSVSAEPRKQPASFAFIAASSGFHSGISAICEITENVLMLSCETDIYLLRIPADELGLHIFRSEPRRSRAYHLASYSVSPSAAQVAIYDEDGIEVFLVDLEGETVFKHQRGDTQGRSGGKVAWLDERHLLVTDKMGVISVLDTADPNSIWLTTLWQHRLPDIPYSLCKDPERPNSMLIGTMLGAIYRLHSTV